MGGGLERSGSGKERGAGSSTSSSATAPSSKLREELAEILNDMEDLVGGGQICGGVGVGRETEPDTDTAPHFFPFSPHLLLALKLGGFFSFLSVFFFLLIFSSAAILASISAFFLRTRSACSDMATSLLILPSLPPAL